MKYVIDTSVLIDHLRGGKYWELTSFQIKEGEFYLPNIVIFELFRGRSTKNPEATSAVLNLLKGFYFVDLDFETARKAGELDRDLPITLQVPDYIIAATALSVGAEVVTLNKKHFEKIPGIQICPI